MKADEPHICLELEVPFADIDAQRIVWHGNYLRYFELARTKLLRDCGLLALLEKGEWELVVSDSHCRHYRALRFGDRCRVKAWFMDIEHRLNVRYLIENSRGEKVARGHTHLVTLDEKGALQLVTPPGMLSVIQDWQKAPADPGRRSFVVATSLLLAGGVGLLSSSAEAAVALPPYMRQVFKAHHESPGIEARFIEKKHIAFLKAPLTSEGALYFSQPELFARITEKPEPSKVVIRDDEILFRRGEEKAQKVSLKGRPELRALVSGIVLLFAGKEPQIAKLYELQASGKKSAWTLTLRPRTPELKKMLTQIQVHGSEAQLKSFEVHEASGDKSVTELIDLKLNRKFSAAEKSRLFRA